MIKLLITKSMETARMMITSKLWLHLLTWSLTLAGSRDAFAALSDERRTYIIHMDHSNKPESFPTHESWHRHAVASTSISHAASDDNFLYSYTNALHGFSARLTPSELSELQKSPAHVATYRDSTAKLFTTHTPSFLGLNHRAGLWPAASYGQDIIIGMIDTGIWPESRSFEDRGMPEVPKRWKGACENGTQFRPSMCNRKLIGARSFSKGLKADGVNISTEHDYDSARDFYGHGTHTASTAAGKYVKGVDYFGYAEGTARGVAPSAHVAMYKVLWSTQPSAKSMASDILAGMDQAIADGVDVISLSLGLEEQTPYYDDVIAIAAFSAAEKGITVVCAAGNDGTINSTYNGAPWITTVGAGTVDRSFLASLTLGNGLAVEGTSYFPERIYIADVPLYYAKAACRPSSLNQTEVSGKVVVCDISNQTNIFEQFSEINRTGALAGIFFSDSMFMDPEDYYIPSIALQGGAADAVRAYAMEAINATVQEMTFVITELSTKPAPEVAYFSSRGPDPITPSVLKPDILAPGKDVVAAWAPNRPIAMVGADNLVNDYALVSGTSMAAPHVAGLAALIKAVHRDWSPAAVRSAIMSTATTVDNTRQTFRDEMTKLPATPFDFGAGHINPNRAMDPGLVYDIGIDDYIGFLCGLGYSDAQMRAVLRRSQWSCGHNQSDLNYPSFVAIFANTTGFPMVKSFGRVVTNVGDDGTVYRPVFEVPKGMTMRTMPDLLVFDRKYQKQEFLLTVELGKEAWSEGSVAFGYLKWVDERNHVVSSPVVAISP